MNCPRDRQLLTSKDYEHVSISGCQKCGGIWMSAEQLKRILQTHENHFSPQLIAETLKQAHAGIPAVEAQAQLTCPECEEAMGPRNYEYSSGIIVNVCSRGHGIWFDENELQSVEIFREHWSEEARTHQAEWSAQIKTAGLDEQKVISGIDDRVRAEVSPSGLLGSVFHVFDKMRR